MFDERFWLPANVSWSDIDDDDLPHIGLSLPIAFLLLVLRFCAEKFCFVLIGRRLSIESVRAKPSPNLVLDKVPKTYDYKQVQGWAKQLDWSERQVLRWLRLRARQQKPTTLDKFCESCWRFIYYSSVFLFGLTMLWDKPWLWDIKECWRTYPRQVKTFDVYCYYTISLAFYCSLIVSQFVDTKRKDFWQMFLHHVATITLIVYSWSANLYRVGTLVLLVHDFADVFLEAAKLTKYSGFKKTCDVIFVVFALSWLVSRMLVFPLWILKSTMYDVLAYHRPFPGYYILNAFLFILFLLHVFWTYLLLKLIGKVLIKGKVVDDIRSSSDSSD